MTGFSVTLVSRRKWVVFSLAAGVMISVVTALIGLCALPGLLFGSRLYYCFIDKYLAGECSRWNRLVAW